MISHDDMMACVDFFRFNSSVLPKALYLFSGSDLRVFFSFSFSFLSAFSLQIEDPGIIAPLPGFMYI